MASFTAADLDVLDKTDEVDLEFRKRTTIWIVRVGDDAYVRSVRGPEGKWFKRFQAGSSAVLHAGNKSWTVTASLAPDAIESVSEALNTKYLARWKGPTEAMLRPEVLETTMRLETA